MPLKLTGVGNVQKVHATALVGIPRIPSCDKDKVKSGAPTDEGCSNVECSYVAPCHFPLSTLYLQPENEAGQLKSDLDADRMWVGN